MEDNIIMDLKEIGINTWNCVDSTQDRIYWRILVIAALIFRVAYVMKLVMEAKVLNSLLLYRRYLPLFNPLISD